MFCVCQVFLSVYCSLVVTCRERADLLGLLYETVDCNLSLCHVVSRVRCGRCLIVSIPDLCLLFFFVLTVANVLKMLPSDGKIVLISSVVIYKELK